jgi:DNA-binding protein H-NS
LLEKEMRKPRDLDGELKALHDEARELKTRKVEQLGELVIATGADNLSADELAGALIVLAATRDTAMKEAWAKRGAAFFQSRARRTAPATERDTGGVRAQPAARNRQQEGARNVRTWQVERRKRTRHLIELGGLVVKAGFVDRRRPATIFGALL